MQVVQLIGTSITRQHNAAARAATTAVAAAAEQQRNRLDTS